MAGLTVVGIPARDEVATVATVATVADAGLDELGGGVVILAENGSTDGTVEAFNAAPLTHRREVISTGGDATGKGTNVFALISRAIELDADRLVLLDADLRSAAPWWVPALARAVDGDDPSLATPAYARDRFEAGTTAHLVTPLLAGTLGATVQQPIGGEFALNRALLREALTWPTPMSANYYGVDIWLVASAIALGRRVVEVELGTKLHSTPFRNVLHLPRQVLDSLLRTVMALGVPTAQENRIVRSCARSVQGGPGISQPPDAVARVLEASRYYSTRNRDDIARRFPSLASARCAPWGRWIDTALWPHVLGDAVDTIATGAFDTARDHLTAIYIERLVTFWEETGPLSSTLIEARLAEQVATTVEQLASKRAALSRTPTPSHDFDADGPLAQAN